MTFKVAGIVGSPRKGMNIDLVDTLVVTIQSMRRVPEKENNFLICFRDWKIIYMNKRK